MLSMTPLVSVVVPAYNHERFVGAALESVLRQTHADFELIVIDDGSTDRTFEIVQSYRDPRIRALTQENQDAFNALNRGMGMARGEYVAILNSDDVFHPNRLERLVGRAVEQKGACLFSNVEAIDERGAVLKDAHLFWNVWNERNRQLYFGCGDLLATLLHANLMITTSNLLIHRRVLEEVGGFAPIRYLHDYEYLLRIVQRFPSETHYVDEKLLSYRIHGANTLKQGAIVAREQDQELIRRNTLLCVPEEHRFRVQTGLDRLLALERELHAVRFQVNHPVLHGLLRRYADLRSRWARAATPGKTP
jgi:glycosyltransferase involved in cell wall biosynthesis